MGWVKKNLAGGEDVVGHCGSKDRRQTSLRARRASDGSAFGGIRKQDERELGLTGFSLILARHFRMITMISDRESHHGRSEFGRRRSVHLGPSNSFPRSTYAC